MADVSVRPARAADAATLAAIQVAAWQRGYSGRLPDDTVAALAAEADGFAAEWQQAITAPPTLRHHVLVACVGPLVVGGVSLGPAEDDDRDPASDGEVFTVLIDPSARRAGHGSRLLAAAVDHLRADGQRAATVWVDAEDEPFRQLLVSSGWAADGARRELDLEGDGMVVVTQVRLHTDLTSD